MIRRRALSLLRDTLHYRADAFRAGLRLQGFEVVENLPDPRPGDLLMTWNRQGWRHERACEFEKAGAQVLVAENGYMGKEFRGQKWFALALGHHAGAGTWPDGGPERWDALDVELEPWRQDGTETLVFEQRAIGEPGIASPPGWAEHTAAQLHGRIRRHPGPDKPAVSLRDDLFHVKQVATWASGAALLALAMGVPVFYGFERWIGAGAARPLAEFGGEPRRDDAARLAVFRKLAWAMWTVEEVQSGFAFDWLLPTV